MALGADSALRKGFKLPLNLEVEESYGCRHVNQNVFSLLDFF